MGAPKVKKVCATCGSENVLADAYADWNVETQEWEVTNTFDKGAYCNTCDGETRLEEEQIEDAPPPPRDEALALVIGAAESYREDLSTGLADGTYEEGADTLPALQAAIAKLKGGA